MERDSTWDIRVGFDKIRWTDDEATVRAAYPAARETPSYEGRDRATGESMVVQPGLVLEPGTFDLPVTLGGVFAYLRVDFDATGVRQIDLVADGGDERFAEVSPEDWNGMIAHRASSVGKVLGVGPVSAREPRQAWTVGDVNVDLLRQAKGFSFTFERAR